MRASGGTNARGSSLELAHVEKPPKHGFPHFAHFTLHGATLHWAARCIGMASRDVPLSTSGAALIKDVHKVNLMLLTQPIFTGVMGNEPVRTHVPSDITLSGINDLKRLPVSDYQDQISGVLYLNAQSLVGTRLCR